jgi:hypothetical protein
MALPYIRSPRSLHDSLSLALLVLSVLARLGSRLASLVTMRFGK